MDLIVIALCGVICGCDSHSHIALYAQKKKDWLGTFLELPGGIPSHDTFSRVFRHLDAEQFGKCFREWVAALVDGDTGIIALDGKTLRHSFDGDGNPLHLVSAWATANHLSLGQVATDDKSNEITAWPRLLELIDVAGALVTIDAMGCQKAIAAKIRDNGGDYLLAVKDNQPTLHQEISACFDKVLEEDTLEQFCQFEETSEHNRGRDWWRGYYSMAVPETLSQRAAWRDLKSIHMAVSRRVLKGQETYELRYYIGSFAADAKRFATGCRHHWGIENSLHYVLDVSFAEDASRIRKDHGPENFAQLRRLAITLLKQDKTTKDTVPLMRRAASWDNDYLTRILNPTV